MQATTIEELAERVAALEDAIAHRRPPSEEKPKKGWETTYGVFHGDPVMKEIMDLAKELRDAERPDDEP